MNARGQFWSLDVVLAGVIFTLALGVIVSQAELSIFYSQQERNQHELVSIALMASNNLVSQADVLVELIPQKCENNPALCTTSCGLPVCPFGSVSIFAEDYYMNVRCGPNFLWVKSMTSPHVPVPGGWLADKELSSLENCIVSRDSPVRQDVLGVPTSFHVDLNALLADGNTILFYTAKAGNASYLGFSRKMIVFPNHPYAGDLRECMDGNCAKYLTDVNIKVWRS